MVDRIERIESIKAGTVAALSFFLGYGIATLGNILVLSEQFETLANLKVTNGIHFLVSMAIACLSGFLFGVTYRYIIREDPNPHLKTGAVFAFGLVRGLGQVEVGLNFPDAFWSFGILGGESILLFAIARLLLDWTMQLGWVKPFKSS